MIRGAHAHISRGQQIPQAAIGLVREMSIPLSQHALSDLLNNSSLKGFPSHYSFSALQLHRHTASDLHYILYSLNLQYEYILMHFFATVAVMSPAKTLKLNKALYSPKWTIYSDVRQIVT